MFIRSAASPVDRAIGAMTVAACVVSALVAVVLAAA